MKILVVESTRIGSRLLLRELQPKGYDVLTCDSADKAIEIVSETPEIGMVMVNLAADEGTGLELCWHLRLLAGPTRPLYILAMSVGRAGDDLIQALDCGADDIISIPLVPEILFARLRAAQRLIDLQNETVRLATHDTLSGLLNRRAFMDRARSAIELRTAELPIAIALLDIDRFKDVNDTYGHEAGDIVIKEVAMLSRMQPGIIARWGGEEFAILYADSCGSGASRKAEQFRSAIERHRIEFGREVLSVTASFGVAEACADEAFNDLIRRADRALYSAKRKGRNRVEIAGADLKLAGTPMMIAG